MELNTMSVSIKTDILPRQENVKVSGSNQILQWYLWWVCIIQNTSFKSICPVFQNRCKMLFPLKDTRQKMKCGFVDYLRYWDVGNILIGSHNKQKYREISIWSWIFKMHKFPLPFSLLPSQHFLPSFHFLLPSFPSLPPHFSSLPLWLLHGSYVVLVASDHGVPYG